MLLSITWAMIARFAVIALFFDGLGPLLPELSISFGATDRQFQKIIALALIVFAVFQLVSAAVIAHLGLYQSIIASSLALVIATVLLCLLENAWLMIGLFIALFAINSIGASATRIALRDLTSHHQFKKIFSRANALTQVLQIFTPGIAGGLAALYGWRWAILGMVLPIAVVNVWLHMSNPSQLESFNLPRSHLTLANARSLLQIRPVLVALLTHCLFYLCFAYTLNWLPFILAHQMTLPTEIVGSLISLFYAASAAGFMLSGYLAGRLKDKKICAIGLTLMVTTITLLMLTQGLDPMSQAATLAWLVGILLLELAYGFIVLPNTAIVMNVHPTHRPVASALLGFSAALSAGATMFLMAILKIDYQLGIPGLIGLAILSILGMQILHAKLSPKVVAEQ